MRKIPNLTKRKGVYYFRKRLPSDIADAYGKSQIMKTLGTKDPEEAKVRKRKMESELDDEIRELRQLAKPGTQTLQQPKLTAPKNTQQICDHYYQLWITEEYEERSALWQKVEQDEALFWSGELIEQPKTHYYQHLMEVSEEPIVYVALSYCLEQRDENRVRWLKRAISVSDFDGYLEIADAHTQPGESALLLSRSLVQTKLKVLQDVLDESPSLPEVIDQELISEDVSTPVLSVVVSDWISEKQKSKEWLLKTKNDRENTLKNFVEICGDKPISAYIKSDARQFKNVLTKLPANVRKLSRYKGLNLRETAEKAHVDGDPAMSVTTANKKLTSVGSFFGWCIQHYDECSQNPFEGMSFKATKAAREERKSFSTSDLIQIFKSPIFTGCQSERYWNQNGPVVLADSAKFWVPLIGLFTGCRLEEILQLNVNDVRGENEIWFFDIEEGEDGKHLKNSHSTRRIPVHSELLSIGLLDFADRQRQLGHKRLFPDVTIGSDGYFSTNFSKFFGRFLSGIGVKEEGKSFHSFRHTFADACNNGGAGASEKKALMGHSEGGMSDRYGEGFNLKTLKNAMVKVSYEGFTLSHLYG